MWPEHQRLLRTSPHDIEFHKSRKMFVIKDDEIVVAPPNVAYSHLEWFEEEGWVDHQNTMDFFENVRGFYLASENALYAYVGLGFFSDSNVERVIREELPRLVDKLELNGETKIHLGPKDTKIAETRFEQFYLGTVEELLADN